MQNSKSTLRGQVVWVLSWVERWLLRAMELHSISAWRRPKNEHVELPVRRNE